MAPRSEIAATKLPSIPLAFPGFLTSQFRLDKHVDIAVHDVLGYYSVGAQFVIPSGAQRRRGISYSSLCNCRV